MIAPLLTTSSPSSRCTRSTSRSCASASATSSTSSRGGQLRSRSRSQRARPTCSSRTASAASCSATTRPSRPCDRSPSASPPPPPSAGADSADARQPSDPRRSPRQQYFKRTVDQYDRLRKRGAYIEQYKKEDMFRNGLEEFDDSRCVPACCPVLLEARTRLASQAVRASSPCCARLPLPQERRPGAHRGVQGVRDARASPLSPLARLLPPARLLTAFSLALLPASAGIRRLRHALGRRGSPRARPGLSGHDPVARLASRSLESRPRAAVLDTPLASAHSPPSSLSRICSACTTHPLRRSHVPIPAMLTHLLALPTARTGRTRGQGHAC